MSGRTEEIEAALGAAATRRFSATASASKHGGNVEEDPHGEFGGRNILYQAHTIEETAAHCELAPTMRARARTHAGSCWRSARRASAAASGRQDPHGLERPDDFGVRQRRADPGRAALCRRGARRRRTSSAASCGTRSRQCCCGAIATASGDRRLPRRLRLLRSPALARSLRNHASSRDDFDVGGAPGGARDRAVRRSRERRLSSARPAGRPIWCCASRTITTAPSLPATPCMALALLRLARMTDREDFRRAAERTLQAFAPTLESRRRGRAADAGGACVRAGRARWRSCWPGRATDAAMHAMLAAIRRRFLPGAVVMTGRKAPHPMPALDGRPTAYVCENFACKLPVTERVAVGRVATIAVYGKTRSNYTQRKSA